MDLFDLTGKTAVVTGGTRGIGLMIARGLLQAGARQVYISSRKAEGCADAERELSQYGQVKAIQADLSTEAECLRLAREVGERESALHVLVNNAGATWGAPLEEFPACRLGQGTRSQPEVPVLPDQGIPPAARVRPERTTTHRGSSTSAASTACMFLRCPCTRTRPARLACTT